MPGSLSKISKEEVLVDTQEIIVTKGVAMTAAGTLLSSRW